MAADPTDQYSSLRFPAKRGRRPDDANELAARRYALSRRIDAPGPPTDDRMAQAGRFTGVPYLAIRAVMRGVGGATLRVTRPAPAKIRKAMPSAGFHAQDEKRLPLDDHHPLAKLLRKPNATQTGRSLLSMLVMQKALFGTGLLWVRPADIDGRPCELWVVPTPLVTASVAPSPDFPRGAWRVMNWFPGGYGGYGVQAAGCLIPREQLAPWRDPHPLHPWDGYSPLTAGARQIDILEAIDEARKSAMDHGFTPDIILNAPGASSTSIDAIEAKVAERAGSRNHRRVFVTDGESIDAKTVSTPPKEMDFGQSWDQMSRFGSVLWGVPPAVSGLSAATSFSELFAANQQFQLLTLNDLCHDLSDFLTGEVCDPWGRDFRVQLDIPEMQDKSEARKYDLDLYSGEAMTVNEFRVKNSLDPVEGGDAPKSVYLAALAQKAAPPPEPPPAPGGPPAPPETASRDAVSPTPPRDPADAGRPDNPTAKGSLPPAVRKALAGLGQPQGARSAIRKALAGVRVRKDHAFDESLHPRDHGKFARAARRADAKIEASGAGPAYRAAKRLGRGAERAMSAAMVRTQAVAAQAARERGHPETHVARVARVLAVLDFGASFAASKGATVATGNPAAGFAAGMLPTASAAYLAYSTAVNPRATLRAARKYLRGELVLHKAVPDKAELAGLLLDYFAGAADHDWAEALLAAAMEGSGGPARAIRRAAAVLARRPRTPARLRKAATGTYAALKLSPDDARRLHAWAESRGVPGLTPATEFHVTTVYSREPIGPGWSADGGAAGRAEFASAARLGKAGESLVLLLRCPLAEVRHRAAMAAGASWDWPSYSPHVTLSNDCPADFALDAVPPFSIRVGPEYAEPLEGGSPARLRKAVAFDEKKHPRDDAGHFVSKDDLAAAKSDAAKAAELRGRVTDPGQLAKLNAAIGGKPAPAGKAAAAPANTSQGAARATPAEHAAAQERARAKFAACPKPTAEEAAQNGAGMDRLGADRFEANARGSSESRKASRLRLLAEFGDGKTCPCVYCGLKLAESGGNVVTRDKMYTARQGGKYRHSNLVPACLACNKSRSDKPFEGIKWQKPATAPSPSPTTTATPPPNPSRGGSKSATSPASATPRRSSAAGSPTPPPSSGSRPKTRDRAEPTGGPVGRDGRPVPDAAIAAARAGVAAAFNLRSKLDPDNARRLGAIIGHHAHLEDKAGRPVPPAEFAGAIDSPAAAKRLAARFDRSGKEYLSAALSDARLDRAGVGAAPKAGPTRDRPNIVAEPAAEHRAAAKAWADASPGLKPEVAARYVEDMSHGLSAMPAGARDAAMASLLAKGGGVRFHGTLTALRAERGGGAAGVVGFARDEPGGGVSVHVDGDADPRGTYVHELWHAADPGGRHSGSPGWRAAYAAEILAGGQKLSDYAMTDPSEGFAEFGRVAAELGPKYMAQNYPRCVDYLRTQGLM